MSGVIGGGLSSPEEGDSRPVVTALLQELGLTQKDIEKLETIPYPELAAAYEKIKPKLDAQGLYTGCTPRVDSSYAGNPLQFGFRRESAQVPLMIGNVFGEFAFAPLNYDKRSLTKEEGQAIVRQRLGALAEELLPVFEKTYPWRNPVDVLCVDALFRQPAIAYARRRSQGQNAPVYAYLFDMDFPVQTGKPAWHCSDIPYFFHNTGMVPAVNVPGVTQRLEQQMFDCLMAFARTGDPNHPGIPKWSACSADSDGVDWKEPVMMFGRECRERCNFDHELQAAMTQKTVQAIAGSWEEAGIIH